LGSIICHHRYETVAQTIFMVAAPFRVRYIALYRRLKPAATVYATDSYIVGISQRLLVIVIPMETGIQTTPFIPLNKGGFEGVVRFLLEFTPPVCVRT
jgi:hypothetical protein